MTAEAPRAGARVLLLVRRERDRTLLVEHLGDEHEVVVGRPGDEWGPFDLCLVDAAWYDTVAAELAARREAAEPTYLPVLLLVHGQGMADLLSTDADAPVDDVVSLPVSEGVLDARVRVALRTRRLSRELDDTRTRLQLAVEGSDLSVWEVDYETDVTTFQQGVADHLGAGEKALSIESFYDIVHPEDRERVREAFRRGREGDGRVEVEYRVRRADTGELRWVEDVGEFEYEAGEATRCIGTGRDVTARVERERELERALDRLTRAQEIADIGAWEFDVAADELQWTEGMYALHRVPESFEPTREAVRELYHPEDRHVLRRLLRTAVETGEPFDRELRLAPGGEEQRWVRIQSEAVCESGEPVVLRGTVQDVTERVEREMELERTVDLFERTQAVADVGGWEYDPAADAVLWTDQTRHIHGAAALAEPSLSTALEFYHPDERPRLRDCVEHTLETGEPFDRRARLAPDGGAQRWVRVRGTRVERDDGTTVLRGATQDVTEQVEQERERERLLDLLSEAQEIADFGSWEYDFRTGALSLSEETYELFGLAPTEEPTVERLLSSYDSTHRATIEAAFENAVRTGDEVDIEVPLAAERGVGWVRVHGRVKYDDGEPVLLRGAVQDVTDRKERERELAASERRFRAVFEASRDAMLLADDEGRYVDANEAACELFGVEHESLLGRHISEFAPEDYDFEENWRSFQAGDRVRGEFPLVRPDGTRRSIEFVATPDVIPGRHLSVVRDVTERKARERELERYELVVRTAGDPIYTVDPDGRFELVNEAVLDLADRPPGAVDGAPVAAVFGDVHAEALADRAAALLADGETEGAVETEVALPNGTRRTFQTRIALERSGGAYRGYACVSHDVTDLREHQRRLSVLDRVLRHNLRNAMNVVLGYASPLSDSSDPEVRRAATAILDAGNNLLSLAEAARRFQSTIDPEVDRVVETDVVERVRHVVEESRLDHPEVSFAVDLPGSARARVPEALDLALTEVVENAAVHSDRDAPRVEVAVETDDGSVVVRVADDGPGVSSLTRRALERGSEGPLDHASGLGLWLVRWAVTNVGGSLDVRENDPRGTVVELRFPSAE